MSVLYLLDACVLIDANRDYYPIERVPEFWEWLLEMGKLDRIKIPQEFYEEVILPPPPKERPDPLVEWLKANKNTLVLDEEAVVEQVTRVLEHGYASDLTDEELIKIGRDPFLVAYALVDSQNRYVVTTEHSSPSRSRANRKLPDVCGDFNVRRINTFVLIQELNFRTDWRGRS
ncbi:MAG: DUF4411 family protein [Caldilineaceae bacterium]|nr:DUF4411 family protein [Caldilineaceae bacterium]MDE0336361.1 DUF4411 family protein [Caldilineaceae bacterium]